MPGPRRCREDCLIAVIWTASANSAKLPVSDSTTALAVAGDRAKNRGGSPLGIHGRNAPEGCVFRAPRLSGGSPYHLARPPDAIDRGRALGIAWARQGDWHNVRAWAELIVAARASSPATAFAPRFDLDIQRHGQRIEQLWRETLRYRKNRAYEFELKQVREAAEWFLINSPNL